MGLLLPSAEYTGGPMYIPDLLWFILDLINLTFASVNSMRRLSMLPPQDLLYTQSELRLKSTCWRYLVVCLYGRMGCDIEDVIFDWLRRLWAKANRQASWRASIIVDLMFIGWVPDRFFLLLAKRDWSIRNQHFC